MPDPTEASRRQEIDLLKAAGIVAVVLIHAMRGPFEADASTLELRIGEVTRFAVPAFLFASGALAARGTPGDGPWWLELRSRLTRLLLPYLVASIAAELFHAVRGEPPTTGSIAVDLLTGAAFGPYYYVFVALPLVALTPLVSRASKPLLAVITVLLLVLQACSELLLFDLPLFWHLRSPALWWAYWFAGCWYGRHRTEIARRSSTGWSAHIVAVLGAGALATMLALHFAAPELSAVYRLASWVGIWATSALLLSLGLRWQRLAGSRAVRSLSAITYTIYLWHLFAVYPLREAMPAAPGIFDPVRIAVPWAGGLLLPLALALVARRFLGETAARRWFGA